MDRWHAIWMLMQIVEMCPKHGQDYAPIANAARAELKEHLAALANYEPGHTVGVDVGGSTEDEDG
jgi:hypothetical protein